MPKVELYDSNVRTTALPTARQSIQTTADDFGGGAAKALISGAAKVDAFSDKITAFAEKRLEEQSQVAADEAFMKASEERRKLLYEDSTGPDGTVKRGLFNREGGAAQGVMKEGSVALNEIYTRLTADMPVTTKRHFTGMWSRSAKADLDSMASHEAKQWKGYKDDVSKGIISTVTDEAVRNYNNPDAIVTALDTAEQRVRMMGAQHGEPAELIEAKARQVKSGIHTAIISRMLADGQDLQAERYFKEAEKLKELDAKDAVGLQKQVEEGSLRAKAQAEEDRIMSASGSHAGALAEARSITEPKLRDEAVRRVNARWAEKEAIRAEGERAAKREAWQIVESKGFDALTPYHKALLDGTTLASMQHRDLQKRKGDPVIWGPDAAKAYKELDDLATDPNRKDEWVKTDLTPYIGRLTEGDWKHFENARKASASADDKTTGVMLSRKEIVDDATKRVLRLDEKKPADATKISAFHKRVNDEIATFQREKGKMPNSQEIQGMTDRLVIQGKVSSGYSMIWDSKKAVYEVDPAEADKFYVARSVDDIPKADASSLRQSLKVKLKRDVSDMELVSIYNQWAKTGKVNAR